MEVLKIRKVAKVKEHYLGNMTQYEIDKYLYNKHIRDAEYDEWSNGEGYVAFVNEELEDTKLKYCKSDVSEAINYAFGAVQITQSEVGSDVYGKLIHEKVFEYLNNRYE